MSRICYVSRVKKFRSEALVVIEQSNRIVAEYAARGLDLTLRQLYYQHVARGFIPNTQAEYKRLGSIVADARMCGLLDWTFIVDRTRNMYGFRHFNGVSDFLRTYTEEMRVDLWEGQSHYIEVWVEKEALAGVLQKACEPYDVNYFSCRGYMSVSAMFYSAQRFVRAYREDRGGLVIHLGDHDPSGIDMTRDIQERFTTFCERHDADAPYVDRIALNMDQVNQYNPPPNPAKMTDSRFEKYLEDYGDESWELDALEPQVLIDMIQEKIRDNMDEDLFKDRVDFQEECRNKLSGYAEDVESEEM